MRVKVSTLVVVAAAAAGLATAAFLMFRESPGSVSAHTGESGRSAGRRPRAVPRFHTTEPAPTPEARPAPPPAFVEAPPPPEFTPPPKTPQQELKERASKDGFLYREEGSDTVYVVQGGTRYAVPSAQEFEALGYKWDQVENVPRGSLGHLPSRPQERVLLRERNSPAVYYYENGQKRGITSAEAFERHGFKWSDIKTIPSGTLKDETIGSPMQ